MPNQPEHKIGNKSSILRIHDSIKTDGKQFFILQASLKKVLELHSVVSVLAKKT